MTLLPGPLTERWTVPHPFECGRHGCARPITCARLTPFFIGWCAAHAWGREQFRVSISGRLGEGWCKWPIDVRVSAELRHAGAWDERGRCRPVHDWDPPPRDA